MFQTPDSFYFGCRLLASGSVGFDLRLVVTASVVAGTHSLLAGQVQGALRRFAMASFRSSPANHCHHRLMYSRVSQCKLAVLRSLLCLRMGVLVRLSMRCLLKTRSLLYFQQQMASIFASPQCATPDNASYTNPQRASTSTTNTNTFTRRGLIPAHGPPYTAQNARVIPVATTTPNIYFPAPRNFKFSLTWPAQDASIPGFGPRP